MRKGLLCLAALLLPVLAQDPARDAEQDVAGPVVGKAAPAFRVNDHTGRGVAVGGKSKAWTVLAFYPKAATPG